MKQITYTDNAIYEAVAESVYMGSGKMVITSEICVTIDQLFIEDDITFFAARGYAQDRDGAIEYRRYLFGVLVSDFTYTEEMSHEDYNTTKLADNRRELTDKLSTL